ncbi:MAG TPA: hypothetical protein VII13_21885 [Vicinamibacteria bacterium]|jgi:hypothetical protein
MKVHDGDTIRLELSGTELRLLRRALERASFIDTPPNEQAEILAFCARALDTLPLPPARA